MRLSGVRESGSDKDKGFARGQRGTKGFCADGFQSLFSTAEFGAISSVG